MTSLAEIRQKYPQYSDLSDDDLASRLHAKHYADMPKAEFDKRIGHVGLRDTVSDVGEQAVRGFNKGLADVLSAPYRGLDWLLETTSGGTVGLPDVDKMPAWQRFREQPKPQTMAGRFARGGGEALGASAIPGLGVGIKAGQAAGPAATTTLGQIGQSTLNAIRANPAAAYGIDAASAVTSGVAAQGAEEAGLGPEWQAIAAMGGGMVPGIAAAYRAPSRTPIGGPEAQSLAARRAQGTLDDIQAFERQGVRQFGPAYNQGPVASVAKQITETPVLGGTLRNNLDETFEGAAQASRRLADDISPNATMEQAGLSVQRGLDRFRTQGLGELEPGVARRLGIDPVQAGQRAQQMGRQQAQRIQQAEPILNRLTNGQIETSRGAPTALPSTRNERLARRTTVEDLPDDQLQRVIRTPADQTSFATRQEALYERAWRDIPDLQNVLGRGESPVFATANSRQVVTDILQDEARTGVTSGLQGRYGQMFATLANQSANAQLGTLRAMRTAIGRDLSNFGLYEATLDRTQLRRLYAALSSDIEVALREVAARAALRSQEQGPRAVDGNAVRQAARALRSFQVADRYMRNGIERMDRFAQIVRTDNPQQAAQQIIRAATEGGSGNMRLVRSALAVLRPEERAQFTALMIREMGAPTDSARGITQEVGFSPSRFATAYTRMSPEVRNTFFSPAHRQALDDLFAISNRIAGVEALTNYSRSGTNALNLTLLGGAGGATAMGMDAILTFGGTAAAMGGTAVLMSSPAYTRWLSRYIQLRAAVRSGADRAVAPLIRHVSGLERMTQDNPALWPAYVAVAQDSQTREGE